MVYYTISHQMKTTTTISIDQRLLERARSAARAQKRSLSAQLERWLEEQFDLHATAGAGADGGCFSTVSGKPQAQGQAQVGNAGRGGADTQASRFDHQNHVHTTAEHSAGVPITRGHRRQGQPLAKATAKGNAVSAIASARGCATELAKAAAPATLVSPSQRPLIKTQVANHKNRPPQARARPQPPGQA